MKSKFINYKQGLALSVVTTKAWFLFILLSLCIAQNVSAEPKPTYTQLPEGSRIWENRNGEEGSGYDNYSGSDVAFTDNAWYYFDNSTWNIFHQGPTLDFNEVDLEFTETLQYEVFSGTAFADDGMPGMYDLILDGATGNLLSSSGVSFNLQAMEKLLDANGSTVYFNMLNNSWWKINDLNNALSKTPPAPYKPKTLKPNVIPSSTLFGSSPQDQLIFDLQSLRYIHIDGGRVAAFHGSINNSYRRWNNNSGVAGSGYENMSGPDIAYVAGVWYAIEDETHYRPFFEGRYLDFNQADRSITEALQYDLITGNSLENEGLPSDLRLKLDGETGELLNESGELVLSADGKRPVVTIKFNKTLILQGLNSKQQSKSQFNPMYSQVKLLRVVPLRNVKNDPFNDRSLPTAIALAQNSNINIVTPPSTITPPPPPGSCPANTTLTMNSILPSGMPLGQIISLSTTSLQAGFGLTEAININIISQVNPAQGNVNISAGFSLVSGSSIGVITEGSSLSYLIRRNSDSTEFEINFSFNVDQVFDDNGIIIQTLSGRLCLAGGPV